MAGRQRAQVSISDVCSQFSSNALSEALADRFAGQEDTMSVPDVLAALDELAGGGGERCGSMRRTWEEDECGHCLDGAAGEN